MTKSTHKYYLILLLVFALLAGCKSKEKLWELSGATNRKLWFEPIPYGMAYVKEGSYLIGNSGESADKDLSQQRRVTVNSFWMDDTEITNNEYRQFTNWVKDSVAVYQTFKNGIDYYKALNKNGQIIQPNRIDWMKAPDIWQDENQLVQEAIDSLYYLGKQKFRNKEIDYRKIFYTYHYIDLKQAAKESNRYDYATGTYGGEIRDPKTGLVQKVDGRSSFFFTEKVSVYPDTLCWVRDFTYSYNDPWVKNYGHHPAYMHYPVVGVSWGQAKAFCHWRTKEKARMLKAHDIDPIFSYRLPTEAEWEYAARGGQLNNDYTWGSYYSNPAKGCYKANFKPKRGNYISDSPGSAKTMQVASFEPNGYGLYDMAGNVAEWTSSVYNELSVQLMNDLNPDIQYDAAYNDPPALKRKVVRGGSWKDVSYFIQSGTRSFEYQDSTKSYIGFRCVMTDIKDIHFKPNSLLP